MRYFHTNPLQDLLLVVLVATQLVIKVAITQGPTTASLLATTITQPTSKIPPTSDQYVNNLNNNEARPQDVGSNNSDQQLSTTIANNNNPTTIRNNNAQQLWETTTTTTAATNRNNQLAPEAPQKNFDGIKVQYLTPVSSASLRDDRASKPVTTTTQTPTIAQTSSTNQQTVVNVVTSTATNQPLQQIAIKTTTASYTSQQPTTTAAPATTITASQQQTNNLNCLFKGRSYGIGEKWFDDCVSKCRCVLSGDNNLAIIACEDRCPKYIDIMPGNCQLQRSQDDECCLEKVCTDVSSSSSIQSTDSKELNTQQALQESLNPSTGSFGDVNTNQGQPLLQQTADDYSQTPITVTDIRLKPTKTTVSPNFATSNLSNQGDFFPLSGNRSARVDDTYNNGRSRYATIPPTTPAKSTTIKQQTSKPTTMAPTTAVATSSKVPLSDNTMTPGRMNQATTNTVPVELPNQQSQDSVEGVPSFTNTTMITSQGNYVDSAEQVDGTKEDLCIVDEQAVYRINQLVEIPGCNKICRCQYTPSIEEDSSNCTSPTQPTLNLFRPKGATARKTEIVCDNMCPPFPSELCAKPRCNAHNICECPYLDCEDTLPLYAHVDGIVPPKNVATLPNKITQPIQNDVEIPASRAEVDKCEFRGRKLAINETFDDECHSRCKCTDKLQVQCEMLTCPSRPPPPSKECTNWAFDLTFRPQAPECCPPLICKDDEYGSCFFMGITIKNMDAVPEEMLGCERQCICQQGKIACLPQICPNPDDQPLPECSNGAMPTQEPTKDCQCPRWVCSPDEELTLKEVSIIALNATAIRVRFTLPIVAINLQGYFQLNYTMDPDGKWEVQKFHRPGRLFDSSKVEYLSNKFKPGSTYFFKIRVLFQGSSIDMLPGPLESPIIKLTMNPASSGFFEQPKPTTSSTRLLNYPTSLVTVDTTTTSTTTTSTTTPSPPKELTFDFNLTSKALGSEVVLVQWRSLTTKERQFVDSYQIKYWSGTSGDDAVSTEVSQLLHKETDRTLIYDLQPDTCYSLALVVNQQPGVPVILRALNASTVVKTQQKQEQQILELRQRELEIELENWRKREAELTTSTQAPSPSLPILTEKDFTLSSKLITLESSRIVINLTPKWLLQIKKQPILVFKIYNQEIERKVVNGEDKHILTNRTHIVYVELTDAGLIIDNLTPNTEYKIWFDVLLQNGQTMKSTSSIMARTDVNTNEVDQPVPLPILRLESTILPMLPTNRIYAWYSLLFLTGLMTMSFTIVLYLLLKKSSSAKAPISSQSAYDNPSFTKFAKYHERPCGIDPNNKLPSVPPPSEVMVHLNNNKIANGTNGTILNNNNNNNNPNIKNLNNCNNINNSHPYNAAYEYQRPEGRLI